jgi:hypothetical protein
MTSPISPIRSNDDYKRKRNDNDEIEELLYLIIDSIHNDKTIKRQKI